MVWSVIDSTLLLFYTDFTGLNKLDRERLLSNCSKKRIISTKGLSDTKRGTRNYKFLIKNFSSVNIME